MESLLCVGLVLGVPIWLAWRAVNQAARQRALMEQSWGVENWEEFDEGYRFTLNFPSMSAQDRSASYYNPGVELRSHYEVRRRYEDGAWQTRHTEASRAAAVVRLRELAATPAGAFIGDKLAELEAGRPWETLREDWQAQIETAYQRYLHRG